MSAWLLEVLVLIFSLGNWFFKELFGIGTKRCLPFLYPVIEVVLVFNVVSSAVRTMLIFRYLWFTLDACMMRV